MSGATTTNPTAKSRPKTSSAYLTASALSNAGFKGWPLVVMTALAGREASWNPTALNNNPSTQDYSVGLWQINYFQNLSPSRTAEFGSPTALLSNPQQQADAAYQLAGGNNLSNLQPWALTSSPASGVVPVGSTASIGKNTLAPYMASSIAAASEVGEFGPAPASQIAQASAWPGASPIGSALSVGGNSSNLTADAATLKAGESSGSGCNTKGPNGDGKVFSADLKITSLTLTYCELKALIGGLCIAAGGVVMVLGLASLIVGGLGSKGARGAVAPAAVVAGAVGKVAGAPRRRSQAKKSPSTAKRASPEPRETQRHKEDRVYDDMQREKSEEAA